MLKMTIEGFPDLESAIKAVGKKAAREAALVAVQYASEPIIEEARRIVRKDTGALAASLTFRTKPYRRGDKILSIIGPASAASGPDGRVPAKYAHFEETGREGQPAHPFLRPALESQKDKAVERLGKTFGVALEVKIGGLAEVKKSRARARNRS